MGHKPLTNQLWERSHLSNPQSVHDNTTVQHVHYTVGNLNLAHVSSLIEACIYIGETLATSHQSWCVYTRQ